LKILKILKFLGLILQMSIFGNIIEDKKFDDIVHWEFEDENTTHDISAVSKDRNSHTTDQISMEYI
jgi:hemerythrin superfamily protein